MNLLRSRFLVFALAAPLASAASGDPVRDGLRLYSEGKYAEAAEAFRAALKDDPENARLNYNLALALWRAGDADAAETAAEKAAALAAGAFDGLRDGILGNLRYDKARALGDAKVEPQKQVEQLEQAVQAAGTARHHFERGATAVAGRQPAQAARLQRNLERAIKLEEELKKRLEEAKKQEQQEKNDKKDEKKDPTQDDKKQDDEKKDPTQDDKKKDGGKQDEQKKNEQKKNEQKKNEQKKPDGKQDQPKDEEQPEPDPKKQDAEDKQPEKNEKKPQPDDEKNEPHEPPQPQRAPGEYDPNKELTPEQRQQLLKRLKQFEARLQELKAARKAARPRVKKDW